MSLGPDIEKHKNARLIVTFFIGVILLNYPILSLFSNKEKELFGLPLLYVFIFCTWAVLIVMAAYIVGLQSKGKEGSSAE